MADLQVEFIQKWLIKNYQGRPAFDEIGLKVNGVSNHKTVEALITALQYELGIGQPTGGFGPTTLRLVPTITPNNTQNVNKKIIQILAGGMWCHGYSPGYLSSDATDTVKDIYDSAFIKGIHKIQADIGITQNGVVDRYLWQAILSTDAYTSRWTHGNDKLVIAQRIMNGFTFGGYSFARDYLGEYIPCDGIGGRTLSNAIITFLQANMGLSPDEATGNLGPTTRRTLENVKIGLNDTVKDKNYTYAVSFALLANGYDIFPSPKFSTDVLAEINKFQRDMLLPETSQMNKETWMALLISYGDYTRKPNAADMSEEVTAKRLQYLLDNDIKLVGRYLTGNQKRLKQEEVVRLTKAGIMIFPIFQRSGNDASYFTIAQAKEDGITAVERASEYGFTENTVIYFAVDFDALNYQIDEIVIPYFRALQTLVKPYYRIGIYGTRNVCTQVVNLGLATTCFVSNMSSGYSGNLGFKMPANWELDQYDEYWVGNVDARFKSDYDFDIDKVMCKRNYLPTINLQETQRSYRRPVVIVDPNKKRIHIKEFIPLIRELEQLVEKYLRTMQTPPIPRELKNYDIISRIAYVILQLDYTSIAWKADFLFASYPEVTKYVEKMNPELLTKIRKYTDKEYVTIDDHGGIIDFVHLFGAFHSHFSLSIAPDDWGSWMGDAFTLCDDVLHKRLEQADIQSEFDNLLGGSLGKSSFDYDDLCADIDAVLFNTKIMKLDTYQSEYFTNLFQTYYMNDAKNRIENFKKSFDFYYDGLGRDAFAHKIFMQMESPLNIVLKAVFAQDVPSEYFKMCAKTFTDYLYAKN